MNELVAVYRIVKNGKEDVCLDFLLGLVCLACRVVIRLRII